MWNPIISEVSDHLLWFRKPNLGSFVCYGVPYNLIANFHALTVGRRHGIYLSLIEPGL